MKLTSPTSIMVTIALLGWGAVSGSQALASNHDPFESANRAIYRANDGLDQSILRPLSVTYTTLTPDPVERGVRNFFHNIGEVRNATNNLLQGKWSATGASGGRFLINSTVGILGLFDVARHIGIELKIEDFGQTLGYWGVGPGPYLVLPLLGPSSIRDSSGFLGDIWLSPLQYSELDLVQRTGLATLDALQTRADLLSSDNLMRGDSYLVLREAYLSIRRYDVADGRGVADAFLDDPADNVDRDDDDVDDDDFVDEGGFGDSPGASEPFVDESF